MTDRPMTPPANPAKRPYVSIEDDMGDFGETADPVEVSEDLKKVVLDSQIQLKMQVQEFVTQNDIRSPDKSKHLHQWPLLIGKCRDHIGSEGQKNRTGNRYFSDISRIKRRENGKSAQKRIDPADRKPGWTEERLE